MVLSCAIGVLGVSVSMGRVSTRRTLLPRVGAEALTSAKPSWGWEGEKRGPEGAHGTGEEQRP